MILHCARCLFISLPLPVPDSIILTETDQRVLGSLLGSSRLPQAVTIVNGAALCGQHAEEQLKV